MNMLKRSVVALSLGLSVFMVGCDNTAKVAESKTTSESVSGSKTITIGYSDYPGYVAWQVAIDKGWFKEAGLNVEFKWFDYSSSLNAFAASQLDAVLLASGDAMLTSAGGVKSVMIMATDYSSGNDVIIAKSGINTVADLKGKSIAVEKGLVDHYLLDTVLKDQKISFSDVKLVNTVTNELPQVFASPDVGAIAVWQPVADQALKAVAGSKIIYSSADKPGLIYDALAVNPKHLSANRDEWKQIIQIWDKTVDYIRDPATRDDAIKIMSARVGVEPTLYGKYVEGTYLLDLEENSKVFTKHDDLTSIYGSTYKVNQFNVEQALYEQLADVDGLIDGSLINELD